MAANATPLKSISVNVPPPLTPGTKVVALTARLEKKDAENEALRDSIAELADALAGLTVVKDRIDADGASAAAPASKKKDGTAPIPAKTAYRFYCDAHPKAGAGVSMQRVWKECAPEIRQSYEAMAKADKARYVSEFASHREEGVALEMYYGKKKQDMAMEFLDAHIAAQAALEKADAEKNKGKKKARAKDPEAPKRPLSSYMYFVADRRDSVVRENPAAAPKEVMKTLGELWGQLEKGKTGKKGTKQYDDSAAEDKGRYESEKKVYNAMIAERTKQAEQQMVERRNKEKEEALELLKSSQEAAGAVASAAANPKSVALDDASVVSSLSVASTLATKPKKPKKKKDPNAPKRPSSAYIFFATENRGQIKAQMPDGTKVQEILVEVGRQWKELTPEEKEKYAKMANEDKERYARDMEKYNTSKK